jgi:hypothetical protein
MRPPAAIGHLDADYFYVSTERVQNPFPRGKAVGVLGNQGACVIAKNYEMKRAGVQTGMPVWEARRLGPRAFTFKRDFRWYEALGRHMHEVVRSFSPVRNIERLVEEQEFHGAKAGVLSVYAGHKDGPSGFARLLLPSPTDRFDLLVETGREAVGRAGRPDRPATRMHVIASQLRRPKCIQPGLFDPPSEQAHAVAKLKREVNAELGHFTLRSGATLPLADVYRDEA